jgi:DNA-binding transcriptional ArsR family regulator
MERPEEMPVESGDLDSNLQQVQKLDRIIHEPSRLVILAALNNVEEADFKFLCTVTGLTKGNLSRQSAQLEEAGYITIRKFYKGRIPATSYCMTARGREAFTDYWQQMSVLQKHFQESTLNT